MVQVVFICLHADLTVGVLLVGNGLQQILIFPRTNIVIALSSSLRSSVIFFGASFLNPFPIFLTEGVLSLGHYGTVAMGSLYDEVMNVVGSGKSLLSESDWV